MSRLTVEQLAGISAKKKKARDWQVEHAGSGPKTKSFAFRDDDQGKIIPQHGRRGRKTVHIEPKQKKLKCSTIFARHLVDDIEKEFSCDDWKGEDEAAKVAVNDITADSTGMPVILDTSVVVEGLLSPRTGSPSRRLMELALADSGEIIPCVTNAIVYEYRRVLEMFGDDGLEQLYRLLFRSILIPVLPDIEIPPVEADHSDTPFVQALVLTMRGSAGNQRPPSRLATYDHHLLNMAIAADSAELLHGRIVTPVQILRELHR